MKKNLIPIALASGVLLAVVFLAFQIHQETEEKVLSQFNEHQLQFARLTARQIESYFQARSQDIRYISSFASVRHLDAKTMPFDIRAIFERLKTVHVKDIFILDEKGMVVYSTAGGGIGSNYARSGMYAWATKPANKGMVRLTIEESDKQGTLATGGGLKTPFPRPSLVTPLYQESVAGGSPGPGGKFFGILLLTVDLEKMMYERTLLFEPAEKLHTVWIADRDGTLLLQSEHPEMVLRNIREKNEGCNRCHVSFYYAEKILTVRQGTAEYQIKGYPRKLAAFAPMTFGDTSWIVVVNASYDEVTGFIGKNFKDTLGLLGVVVLAMGSASYYLYRNYRQRMVVEEEVKHLKEKQGLMEELRERETDLREAQRVGHVGSWKWEPKTDTVTWSEELYHIAGRDPRSKAPNFAAELSACYTPKSWERLQGMVEKSVQTGASYEADLEMVRPDGTTRWTAASGEVVRDARGRLIGLRGTVYDITERTSRDRALKESEEQLRIIFEGAKDGILLADMESRRFSAGNRAVCGMLQYSLDEIRQLGVTEIHPEEDLPWILEAFERQARQEIDLARDIPVKRKDGSVLFVDIKSSPITISGRSYLIGNFRDVTERKKLESQLFVSQKMEAVGRLAGGIAHDFNNLLTVILGYCDLASNRVGGQDPLRLDLEEIRKASERCATLTRQLLAFSRKQILVPKVIDLNNIVADMDKMLRRLIGEDIELTYVPGADLGRVRADPGQIEQVIVNLAVNSRDAMPRGGKLIIATANVMLDDSYARLHEGASPGSYVMLEMSDTGLGMDEKTVVKIFEPFFTTKEKGTGLGLSTVYGIVKQSGGYINVYSERGIGTTFKMYFPRVEEKVTEILKPVLPRPEELRGSETILLVEDEDLVRQMVREILVQYGYNVLEANNGDEAFELCSRHQGVIHLMLTDVVMPGISGMELSKKLAPMQPGMKVLFMSGYTRDAIVHQGVLDPGIAFIQKPFSIISLAQKIREVLDSGSSAH